MKYLYATLNILEAIFAMFGFYIVMMTLISVLSGQGTIVINGECYGKCPVVDSK